MDHPVVHFEIGCKDSAKTQDFYAKLFGWKISQMGPAAMIDAGGGPPDTLRRWDMSRIDTRSFM